MGARRALHARPARRRRLRIPRAAASSTGANLIAIGLLAAFVAWSFASIAWAEVQGTALDGANRSLVYLLVYAVFSIVAWRADSAAIILGLYSVGLAVAGAFVLADAAGSQDAALSLVNGRMAEPTGYPNAVAALFIGGFWPAVHLASRREVPWFLRGLLLAAAGFLVQLALLPQSRASLLVIPFAVVFYLLVTPNRIRAFISPSWRSERRRRQPRPSSTSTRSPPTAATSGRRSAPPRTRC